MMFSFCSLKNPFEEHKRGHELSTPSSAVVHETVPNWSGSSGAVFFLKVTCQRTVDGGAHN